MRRARKGSSSKRTRSKRANILPRVWAVTGCTCEQTDYWGEVISLCWRCVIAGLPGAQETKKNRVSDRKLYRKLVRAHGKKSLALKSGMRDQNLVQILDSVQRRTK